MRIHHGTRPNPRNLGHQNSTMPTIEQLQDLLQKEPRDAFLNFGLAMSYRSAGRTEEALAQFDLTLEIDPNYIAAFFHKGQLQAQVSDIEGARATLTTGIETAKKVGDGHAEGEMTEFRESL